LNSPKIGDRVVIAPTGNPVPFQVRLRRGVTPAQNKSRKTPLRQLTGPEEVVWSHWWGRRMAKGEIAFAKKAKEKKGGDK
jgi:hypothetical protein